MVHLRHSLVLLLLLTLLTSDGVAQETIQRASITVDATKAAGPISPLLYGHFLEFMFEGVKSGLHAELLKNRSFDEQPNAIGLPRYWDRYPDDRNDDYALNFQWDDKHSYPERTESDIKPHALLVKVGEGVIPRHGFFQSRIPLRAGLDYVGSAWLRTSDYEGRVSLALEQDTSSGRVYSESTIQPVKGEWRRYEFRLRSPVNDPLARVAVLFSGRGQIWIDQLSLMPADAADGVRRDVFTKIKELKPGFLRWPGGNVAQDYHWLWGVGPRDERTSWVNLSWKSEVESGDFGTAEYVKLSRNVGAEPTITVNVEGRGAAVDEAAAWVEYCNGPTATKFGALRAAHGYPQPFNVKLWEIGNEIWGSWVRGHSDAETYARNLSKYAAAMRKVDPSIKLIAVGDNDMSWNRTVLTKAGSHFDYLAIHHYYGRREIEGQLANLMARPLHYQKFYDDVANLIKETNPGRDIKLAINEWGLDLPVEQQYSTLSALYGARLLNVFERSAGLVAMSAVSDLVNGWPGGIIQASRDDVFVSSLYLVNQLYSETRGAELLAFDVQGPTFDSTREGKNVPYLDVVASKSADGKQIFIKVVNTNLERAVSTSVAISGARVTQRALASTIASRTMNDHNSFTTPNAIQIKQSAFVGGSKFVFNFPARSVTVLTLVIKQ
jgi:alpha-N-arabinofuranosidase